MMQIQKQFPYYSTSKITKIIQEIHISEKNCRQSRCDKEIGKNFSDNSAKVFYVCLLVMLDRKGKTEALDSMLSSVFGIIAPKPFSLRYLFANSGETVA